MILFAQFLYFFVLLLFINSAKHREKWTFEDEEELKSLYEQYRDSDG